MKLSNQKQSSWKLALILFFVTSMVESAGMSHVFSFMPVYLQNMNVGHIETWVGVLSALTFIVGLPLIPLWGVWADRFGGKSVIIRSAYVEMAVFIVLGMSHILIGVVISMLMVGFQLGNTGIMLSSIRKLVPNGKVGFAISLFSVSSPIGMAVGPLVGGVLTSFHVVNLHDLYFIDGLLSFITGTMLLLLYHENQDVRGIVSESTKLNTESVWVTAWKSVHFTFSLYITWVLFGVYTVIMMARQMVNPYLPIAIEHLHIQMSQSTLFIGVLMGLSALVGSAITVFAGKLGDRLGFTRILFISFVASVPVTALLGFSHKLVPFTICLTLFSAFVSIGSAMVFTLFSTLIPESHRNTALNLIYLPLYFGGIVGPTIATGLTHFGLFALFVGASLLFLTGTVFVAFTLLSRSWRSNTAQVSEQNL